MKIEEKLQQFRKIAIESARTKSNREVDDYKNTLDETFLEYKEMKEKQREEYLKAERVNLLKEKNKTISLEQIRIKHEYSQRSEELKNKLFSEVWDQLANYMRSMNYETLLVKLIMKDLEYAKGEPITIYIDPADADHLRSLQTKVGFPLQVSEYSFGGGIRAVLPNRRILLDDSFNTKLEEVKENFSFQGREF